MRPPQPKGPWPRANDWKPTQSNVISATSSKRRTQTAVECRQMRITSDSYSTRHEHITWSRKTRANERAVIAAALRSCACLLTIVRRRAHHDLSKMVHIHCVQHAAMIFEANSAPTTRLPRLLCQAPRRTPGGSASEERGQESWLCLCLSLLCSSCCCSTGRHPGKRTRRMRALASCGPLLAVRSAVSQGLVEAWRFEFVVIASVAHLDA